MCVYFFFTIIKINISEKNMCASLCREKKCAKRETVDVNKCKKLYFSLKKRARDSKERRCRRPFCAPYLGVLNGAQPKSTTL